MNIYEKFALTWYVLTFFGFLFAPLVRAGGRPVKWALLPLGTLLLGMPLIAAVQLILYMWG